MMNERIEELYNLAHEEKPIVTLDPETFEPIVHDRTYRALNPEKFAELIVKECIDLCVDITSGRNIEEHFGVKL